MHFDDHPPPHFHVKYSGTESRMRIEDLHEFSPLLPKRVLRRVRTWASKHQIELWEAWYNASVNRDPGKIEP